MVLLILVILEEDLIMTPISEITPELIVSSKLQYVLMVGSP